MGINIKIIFNIKFISSNKELKLKIKAKHCAKCKQNI